MDNLSPHSESTPPSEQHPIADRHVDRSLVVLLILVTLVAVGLGIWGYSEHSRAGRFASESGEPIAILSAFEAAFESGKYEEVRAIFTDDGILTTASNTHWAFYTGDAEKGAGVDGAAFQYLATLHGGQDLTILGTPIQVNDNTIAFGWSWSSGVSGTAILHLRDGKIVIAILNPSQYQIPPGGG